MAAAAGPAPQPAPHPPGPAVTGPPGLTAPLDLARLLHVGPISDAVAVCLGCGQTWTSSVDDTAVAPAGFVRVPDSRDLRPVDDEARLHAAGCFPAALLTGPRVETWLLSR